MKKKKNQYMDYHFNFLAAYALSNAQTIDKRIAERFESGGALSPSFGATDYALSLNLFTGLSTERYTQIIKVLTVIYMMKREEVVDILNDTFPPVFDYLDSNQSSAEPILELCKRISTDSFCDKLNVLYILYCVIRNIPIRWNIKTNIPNDDISLADYYDLAMRDSFSLSLPKDLNPHHLFEFFDLEKLEEDIPETFDFITKVFLSQKIPLSVFYDKLNSREISQIYNLVFYAYKETFAKDPSFVVDKAKLMDLIARDVKNDVSNELLSEPSQDSYLANRAFIDRNALFGIFLTKISKMFTKEQEEYIKLWRKYAILKVENKKELSKNLVKPVIMEKEKPVRENSSALQVKLNELELKYRRLQKDYLSIKEKYDSLKSFQDELEKNEAVEELDIDSSEIELLSDIEIKDGTILFGGHPRWQKFISTAYPQLKLVDGNNTSFSKNIISDSTPLVLINVTHMNHACYKKLMPILKAHATKYIYLHGGANPYVEKKGGSL